MKKKNVYLFVSFFVFPVNKIQESYTKSCNITVIWRHNNCMQSYNGSLEKGFEEWIIVQ